jgi:hypothetical protein
VATLDQALAALDKLVKELRLREPDITKFDAYYRGDHKLRFASDQFNEFFSNRYKQFSDNWTAVVAEAPAERLEVVGIRPKGGDETEADEELWDVWLENEADGLSDLAWVDAIIGKRAFALVWGDDELGPRITWEHPSQAIVSYDPETRERRAGLKLWRDDGTEFATLYLPDSVWKFQRPALDDQGRTPSGVYVIGAVGDGGWRERRGEGDSTWPLPNPLGVVPLVEFANRPRLLGEPLSDIAGTVAMQDAVNLLWAYLFNAADYASFPQRVVLGAERPVMPVLDEQGQIVGEKPVELEKFAVNRVAWIEDPNAKIGEWSAANLDIYGKVIELQVAHIAAQTRTPQHYLVGKMANLSADALKAAETGLVKRTEEKTKTFGRAVREVFALVALAQGNEAKAKAVRGGTVLWKDVESRSEAQLVDGLQKLSAIGFPFEYLAERYGMSPAEIKRVLDMRKREQEEDPLLQAGRMLGDSAAPAPQSGPQQTPRASAET